jgi:glycosyltransferase involved in cell wall biosynthesis
MIQTLNQTIKRDTFEEDPHPGEPKILFIGIPYSPHTNSWIDLLDNTRFNVRLFSASDGYPSKDWNVRTYLISRDLPVGLNPLNRKCLFPTPEEWKKSEYLMKKQQEEFQRQQEEFQRQQEEFQRQQEEFQRQQEAHPILKLVRLYHDGFTVYPDSSAASKLFGGIVLLFYFFFIRLINGVLHKNLLAEVNIRQPPKPPSLVPHYLDEATKLTQPKASTAEDWLVQVISEWQPDIIHTIGFFDGQGGEFYYETIKKCQMTISGKWILQLAGGSDLSPRWLDPAISPILKDILNKCDQVIVDNITNITYLKNLEVPSDKIAAINPAPGAGGLDVEELFSMWNDVPSKRRLILIPKMYESLWSKGMPILEAIKIAWSKIQPCEINILASSQDIKLWYWTLPEDLRRSIHILGSIPKSTVLEIMCKSRVVLAPSLVDGIPNVLFEAMATGAFPIVSPLETIMTVVNDEENVLFARNLYPTEIADALIKALTDDRLVDSAAQKNSILVRKMANRKVIQPKVIRYYESLIENKQENAS